MMRTTLLTTLAGLLICACSNEQANQDLTVRNDVPASNMFAGNPPAAESAIVTSGHALRAAQPQRNEYLAYTHSISIEIDADDLRETYDAVLQACADDASFQCSLLNSNMTELGYTGGNISLRATAAGIEYFIQVATGNGEIVQRSTYVEDLEHAITDADGRIRMLQNTRERLMALEQRPDTDIDALIRITTELSRVQSELEMLQGRRARQATRVERQVLNIQYTTGSRPTQGNPIVRALKNFGTNIAFATAAVINVLAVIIPWLLILAPLAYGAFKLRQRYRRRS